MSLTVAFGLFVSHDSRQTAGYGCPIPPSFLPQKNAPETVPRSEGGTIGMTNAVAATNHPLGGQKVATPPLPPRNHRAAKLIVPPSERGTVFAASFRGKYEGGTD